ncbi:HipA family kinase [Vibrio coralliirubri]|uniref:HipA family kinase n=1 Tax=Vibrio coralliirubri TaxID=1516159 RepID=UPI0006359D63|nr:HipA family kinase [Vibrio coralliirubri]CAH6891455.1 conserved hypothetical protein [Vibrio chagasii]CDU15771.1 conserved hypothetical protein [Vibrio coralliirubri]
MDNVELARMLPGAVPFRDLNRNPTWRAHIQTESGIKPAFVKLIEPRSIFVECACALLGRELGLPIPKPSIVLITSDAISAFSEDQQVLAYGSEDVQHPSLLRMFSEDINHEKAFEVLAKHPQLLDVSVFDEWIANSDRHFSNILYGGDSDIYFIDHELAIPEALDVDKATNDNQLLRTYFSDLNELDKHRARKKVESDIMPQLNEMPFALLSEKSGATQFLNDEDIVAVIDFLSVRLEHLRVLFDERIKLRQKEIVNL